MNSDFSAMFYEVIAKKTQDSEETLFHRVIPPAQHSTNKKEKSFIPIGVGIQPQCLETDPDLFTPFFGGDKIWGLL